jgi:hypothetical protein
VELSQLSGRGKVKLHYLDERAAMAAEWHFLQAVPAAARERALAKLRKKIFKPLWMYGIAERVLKNSSLPLEEYLRAEHAAGRYSYRGFYEQYHRHYGRRGAALIAAGALAIIVPYLLD